MTTELKLALSLSAGLHVGALIGWPLASSVEFDVERAPTSLEIVLVAPATPRTIAQASPSLPPIEPQSTAAIPEPDPVPETVVTPKTQGALTEVLPGYRRNPPPVYPRLARERGYEGTVRLAVEVLASGRCGRLEIAQSAGYAMLDEAAARAVRTWEFKPARRAGKPVAVWVEIPVTFRLIETP